MDELIRKDKIDFIEKQGIKFYDYPEIKLSTLLRVAITKELLSDKTSLECFGYFDLDDSQCDKCFLNENGTCKAYQDYLKFVKKIPYLDATMRILDSKGVLVMENFDVYIEKLNLRQNTTNLSIAKLILESNDKSFPDIITKIMELCGVGTTCAYAKVRFFQMRKLIQDRTDLNLEIKVQKYMHISKKVSVDNASNS